jgi:pimeloyl-ACP methyl ester carboxylesterase
MDGTDRPGPVKQRARVGDAEVAYLDTGAGPVVLLLHGCPFSAFVWRRIIPALSGRFRCIAPDLLGLGDTETPPGADWTLPAQAAAVLGLLDHLGVGRAAVVGHDHGGAVAQLIAARHPDRVTALVLADAEAYDNWPSAAELPFVRATQLPVLGRLVLWAWSRRRPFRWALAAGRAVQDRAALSDDLVDGYIAANLADARRRAKTRRFLAAQLDPANQRHTVEVAAELTAITTPTLIVWGGRDVHFPPGWAHRLHADISGARLEILPTAGHLLMEEQPAELAALLTDFLTTHPAP